MKHSWLLALLLLTISLVADSDVFTRSIGGSDNDFAFEIQQTADGGYIIAGQTDSFGNGSLHRPDIWIIKLDDRGAKVWERTFGDPEKKDGAFSVRQTADLGYIVAGVTESFGAEYPSIWIARLDASGDSLWTRMFIGPMVSSASAIRATADGGYILCGKGKENLLKLDANGKREWGTHFSWVMHSVRQTTDGGYIAVGDSIYRQREWDYIPALSLIKFDREGNREWCNTLGDAFTGSAHSIEQTSDGGFILAGDSLGPVSAGDYSSHFMVMKLDAGGRRIWSYHGDEFSSAQCVRQTADGGYVAAGNVLDADHAPDFQVIKLAPDGRVEWKKSFGKSGGWEYASSVEQTTDRGFIVAGQVDSYGAGRYDMWILKLDALGNGEDPVGVPDPPDAGISGFSLSQNYPNPSRHSTAIRFELPSASFVTLTVFDMRGRIVQTILSAQRPAGMSEAVWNTGHLPGGIYFYCLQAGRWTQTRRMLVQR